MEVIEIIAGLVTIAGGCYGLWMWLKDRSGKHQPSNLFLRDGNIHLMFKTGNTTQVTFSHADATPILGKRKIIFFREDKANNGGRAFSRYRLMSLELSTLKETTVSDQKPFADGLDNSYEILKPGPLIFSVDESSVLFTIEKYVTASQLVKVNVSTGKWTELFSVEKVEIIRTGEYKGKLLIARSEVRDGGRGIYYAVSNLDGSIFRDLQGYDEYMQFRSSVMINV